MKSLKRAYTINAGIDKVFKSFTDEKLIEQWSGSPAQMNVEQDGIFSLWEGQIHGINKKISKSQIVQDWKEEKWDHYSTVIFNLSGDERTTKVELIHEEIPEKSFAGINEGWDKYYMGPMKELLESNN